MIMEKKLFIWSVLLVFSLTVMWGCNEKKEPERIIDKKYKEVILGNRRAAMFHMARSYMPGSSLAVSVKGKLVWSEGFGFASQDFEVPASRHTKYRIGGISQVLTSLVYYQMIEDGKLDSLAEVGTYLSDMPVREFPVLMKHLVLQTSGIRTPNSVENNQTGYSLTIRKGLEEFMNDSLLFPPGEFQYQTIYATNLLGAIIEQVEGDHFHKVVANRLLDTLGMENTVPDNPFAVIKDRTEFYDRDFIAQTIRATSRDFRYRLPADGYLSTAEDLVKLGNELIYGNVLSRDLLKNMLTRPVIKPGVASMTGNGLIYLQTDDGKPFFAARGNVTGGGAMLIIYPEEELVLAWMVNLDDQLDELPGMKIASDFRDFINGKYKPDTEVKP